MIRDKSMSAWQTGILMFIMFFANKILILPSLLFSEAKFEGIFVIVLLFLLEFALLILFYKIKNKYPSISFYDLVKTYFGKITTKIVFFFVTIYFLGKIILLYNVTYIFFSNLIYRESNNLLFLVCFLPVISHLAVCGMRTIGRTAQIFFPAILFILIFSIAIGIFGIEGGVVVEQAKFSSIIFSSLKHLSSFGDVIILFLFMDKIEIKKGEWKVLFSLSALSILSVLAVVLVFFLSYTYTSFLHPFAFFEILSFVKEYYGGLGRIDIISMVFIIILTYFQLAVYLKAFFVGFDGLFPKLDRLYSVLTFNFLFVIIITFAVINLSKIIVYGESYLPYLSIISFVIIPICVITALFGKKNKEKKE